MCVITKQNNPELYDALFENNDFENNDFVYSASHKIYTQVVKTQDEAILKALYRYCEENNVFPNIIDEDKLKLILQLGINEYNKRFRKLGEN